MERRNFLLQEIEKLTRLIKKILGIVENITSENFEIEFKKVDHELADFFGFTFEELAEMENSVFINKVNDIDEINLELLTILISKTVKTINFTTNNCNVDSTKLANKGLALINLIDDKSKTFSISRMNLKKELRKQLNSE